MFLFRFPGLRPLRGLAPGCVLAPLRGAYIWNDETRHGYFVLVGAPQYRDQGAAFLFDAATGQQLWILYSPHPYPSAEFGYSVDLSGGKAIVGMDRSGTFSEAASAYLFDVHSGDLLHRLRPFDPQRSSLFGSAVALTRTHALVGAHWYGNMAGSAYLFDVSTGQQTAKFSITPTSKR